jgi:hypothetical protein
VLIVVCWDFQLIPFLQVVSTVFHHKANGVGYLDPGSEDDNVELYYYSFWLSCESFSSVISVVYGMF